VLGFFLAAIVTTALSDEGVVFAVPYRSLVIFVIAAIIVGLLAWQVVDLRGRVDNAPVATAAQFGRAMDSPGARHMALSANGAARAQVVMLPDGTGYWRNDRLAPLDDTRTYQLWALVGSASHPTAISAGVLGNDPRVAAFKIKAAVVGFAVTAEQANGVATPQHQPVAEGMFA
jgi:hypothetical protein